MTATRLFILGLAVSLCLHTGPVRAQDRLSFSLHPAIAIPGDLFVGNRHHTGVGIGLGADYRIWHRLAIYGAWDWYRFPTVNEDVDYTYSSGPSAGLQLGVALSNVLGAWVRAGGTYTHLAHVAGDRNLGWETGAGLELALGRGLSLSPAIRYRTFTRTYTIYNFPNGSLSTGDIAQLTTERYDFTTVELAVAFRR